MELTNLFLWACPLTVVPTALYMHTSSVHLSGAPEIVLGVKIGASVVGDVLVGEGKDTVCCAWTVATWET